MIQRVVIVGAGVGGLGAALGLARRGVQVTIVDRDPPPPDGDGEAAFASWERDSVPQARQPHGFAARTRNLLLSYAPDVVQRLLDWGVNEWNVLDLAPAEMRIPEDDQFTGLLVRRLPFERVLREVVESEPNVTMLSRTVAEALRFDAAGVANGVQLRDGRVLEADLVIDAGGRRSPFVDWLADRGVKLTADVQDCNMTYYGRYFRQRETSGLDRETLVRRNGTDLGYMQVGLFDGDHRSFAIFLGTPPWDADLKILRHNVAWEAAAASIPAAADWVDPRHSQPITDVLPMAGHTNVLRRWTDAAGDTLAPGILPVGDSLCTTNPAFGWGASLALTYAFAAVEAVTANGGDVRAVARSYHAAVDAEAEAYFRVSAAQDRLRTYAWRGEEVPEHDLEEAERQDLLQNGLQPAMRRDLHVLRAMMRRMALIDHPDAIWSDEQALAAAREVAAWRKANRPPEVLGPSRDEMLAIVSKTAREPVAVP